MKQLLLVLLLGTTTCVIAKTGTPEHSKAIKIGKCSTIAERLGYKTEANELITAAVSLEINGAITGDNYTRGVLDTIEQGLITVDEYREYLGNEYSMNRCKTLLDEIRGNR